MIDINKPMRVKGTHEPAKVVFVDEMVGERDGRYLTVKQYPTCSVSVTTEDGDHWLSLRDLDGQLENVPEAITEPPEPLQAPQEEVPLSDIPSATEMAQRAKKAQGRWVREKLVAHLRGAADRRQYQITIAAKPITSEVRAMLTGLGYTVSEEEDDACTISWDV